MKALHPLLVAAALVLAAPSAMAVSTFYMNDNTDPGACTQDGANANAAGNQYTCSMQGSSADELAVRAYANTGSGAKFAAARVGDYGGGFGVTSGTESHGSSPEHGMDNNVNIEGLLLNFDASFALTSLQAGWWNTDSDVTLLAWTGLGDPTAALTGATTATLLGSGWSLVGSYSNIETNVTNVNAGLISSSYWLVTAYNSTFGGGQGWTAGNDYVKLKMVSGNFTCVNSNDPGCNNNQAPEPTSLALVGAALLGTYGLRRRRRDA